MEAKGTYDPQHTLQERTFKTLCMIYYGSKTTPQEVKSLSLFHMRYNIFPTHKFTSRDYLAFTIFTYGYLAKQDRVCPVCHFSQNLTLTIMSKLKLKSSPHVNISFLLLPQTTWPQHFCSMIACEHERPYKLAIVPQCSLLHL